MLQSCSDGLGAVLCSPCLFLLLLLVLLGADAMQVLLHGCTFAVTYDDDADAEAELGSKWLSSCQWSMCVTWQPFKP